MRSRIADRLQKSVIDPLDRLASPYESHRRETRSSKPPGGARGGPRVTPVCDGLEEDTFWIVAQRGHDADYVRNIEANPRVRVKGSLSNTNWRAGTARVLDDDDPAERMRLLGATNHWRRLCLETSASVATNPLTIRIDLDPE